MITYRDNVTRITLPQIRAMFTPKEFARRDAVRLTHGSTSVVVRLLRDVVRGSVTTPRVFLECPSCAARVNVVGFQLSGMEPSGNGFTFSLGCRVCQKWKTREAQTTRRMTAPHLRPVAVDGD